MRRTHHGRRDLRASGSAADGENHYLLLFAGGLGFMFDAMDGAVVAFILPDATREFALSSGRRHPRQQSADRVLIGALSRNHR